mmetsp:Transcript_86647/g.173360  ORF Transcript_86647/g.173360 Transcript_86647/m.173360 type:complete len:170 (+) Transcript_86647:697-1206(+)
MAKQVAKGGVLRKGVRQTNASGGGGRENGGARRCRSDSGGGGGGGARAVSMPLTSFQRRQKLMNIEELEAASLEARVESKYGILLWTEVRGDNGPRSTSRVRSHSISAPVSSPPLLRPLARSPPAVPLSPLYPPPLAAAAAAAAELLSPIGGIRRASGSKCLSTDVAGK